MLGAPFLAGLVATSGGNRVLHLWVGFAEMVAAVTEAESDEDEDNTGPKVCKVAGRSRQEEYALLLQWNLQWKLLWRLQLFRLALL